MNDQLPLAYVIVVTYNGKRFLDKCFSTLAETEYPNMRLLLIDNGSTDDSAEFVRRNFPQVEIIRLQENTGLGYVFNQGYQHVLEQGAEFIAIFNDDTEIVDTRWLGHAVSLAESDDRVGVVGFVEVNPPDQPVVPASVEVADVDYVCGFAMGFRSDVLENIGPFDPHYVRFALEDDWEVRVVRAGYCIKMLSIPIYHHYGGTNQKYPLQTAYLQMRDALRFCIKQRGLVRAAMRLARMMDVACNPWPFSSRRGDGTHERIRQGGNLFLNGVACCCAAAWNLIHLPQTLRIGRREARQIRLAHSPARPRIENEAKASRTSTALST